MTPSVDLVVRGARVWSDGGLLPGVEAIAVAAGRIVALGPEAWLEEHARRASRVVDAGGGTVTPGITDAHVHLLDWARSLHEVDLTGSASRSEALAHLPGRGGVEERPQRDGGRGLGLGGGADGRRAGAARARDAGDPPGACRRCRRLSGRRRDVRGDRARGLSRLGEAAARGERFR